MLLCSFHFHFTFLKSSLFIQPTLLSVRLAVLDLLQLIRLRIVRPLRVVWVLPATCVDTDRYSMEIELLS